jgi:DnaJ family protein C protein 2
VYNVSSRDTRKWVEKQNKTQRAKLKKEEMARIRRLVETSYECDPRVQRFRQDDKESKLAQKQARQNAIIARKEEEERVSILIIIVLIAQARNQLP